jgi:TolA-binding protein
MSDSTAAIPQTEFDPQIFWDQHKNKIIIYGGLFIVALIIWAISEYTSHARAAAASAMLAHASKAEDYKALIEKYPRSVAAGDASLLLGKQQRDEKKYDDAIATLRNFTEKSPEHPLVHAGLLSLAETLQAQGKIDEALSTYQQVATKYPDSYSAPIATLAQASLLKSQGKTEDARRIYENFIGQFQDSTFTQEAMRELKLMRK